MIPRLAAIVTRLRLLLRRDQLDRELDDELRFHVEMNARQERAQGASDAEAQRAARLRLGNAARLREESRAVFGFPRLESLARDASLAMRRLRRAPGFTLAAIATLALAIGANTALFALVDAVVLRPFPYPEPERLVALVEHAHGSRSSIAPGNIADYRVPAFESLAAWHFNEKDLSDGGRPETLFAHEVTHDFFAVLGVGPVLGRAFLPEEDREGGPAVVIITDGLWRARFAGRPRDRRPQHPARPCPAPGGGRAAGRLQPAGGHVGPDRVALRARGLPGRAARQPRRPRDEPGRAPEARRQPRHRRGPRSVPSPSGWPATSRTPTARCAPRWCRSTAT